MMATCLETLREWDLKVGKLGVFVGWEGGWASAHESEWKLGGFLLWVGGLRVEGVGLEGE